MHGGDGGGGVCEVWGYDECMDGMGEGESCVGVCEVWGVHEGDGEGGQAVWEGMMSAWRGLGRGQAV